MKKQQYSTWNIKGLNQSVDYCGLRIMLICLNSKWKPKKVHCAIFQLRVPTHPTAHLRKKKQAIRKWLWSGDTSTEMQNDGFTRYEVNKNIIATTGGKSRSKAKLSPADEVLGCLLKELCGKLRSDGVTSLNQMFVPTCVCSYITAPMVKWRRRLKQICLFACQALSVSNKRNKRLPSRSAKAIRSLVTRLVWRAESQLSSD